jgi:hypothetical protein
MADRQAGGSRSSKPARRRPRRLTPEALLPDLGASRPPCSVAEREIAEAVRRRLRACGLRPVLERVRAPSSPTWAPLLRALTRVWAAAFLAAGWPEATMGLAAAAILGGLPGAAGLIRFVPLLGARSANVVALRRGTDRKSQPLIIAAHLDTHTTAGAPMNRFHVFGAATSAWVALVAAYLGRPGGSVWRVVAALVAAESVATLAWLSGREIATPKQPPDDNTSGVLALIRAAERASDAQTLHDVWFVGTGAGTSGSYGMTSFLRAHRELNDAWVVEIDALGGGEVVAAPFPSRFPYPGTPAALTRAVSAAARESGDPMMVRRVYRPHSDARAALRRRVGAIVLTGGIRPPSGALGPDPANAERAARVVDRIARTANQMSGP